MGAFPNPVLPVGPLLTPFSVTRSIGGGLYTLSERLNDAASTVWPSANLALYVPILLSERVTVSQFFSYNGAAVGNNLDLGLYTEDGTRVLSTGSVAQSGTNTIQEFDVTDTAVGPGVFFLAAACNGTTSTLFVANPDAEFLRMLGCFQQASAFALPATATFAAMAQAYVPVVGICIRSVI